MYGGITQLQLNKYLWGPFPLLPGVTSPRIIHSHLIFKKTESALNLALHAEKALLGAFEIDLQRVKK